MSGPKCYQYAVQEDPAVVAAREEAAALAAARGRAESALARLERVAQEASALRARYGDAISAVSAPPLSTAKTSEEMAREAERLERQAGDAEARLQGESGNARKASFLAQLAATAGSPSLAEAGLDRLLAAAASRTAKASETAANQRDVLAAESARVYDRLRTDVPDAARARVEQTLELALSALSEDRAPLLVDRLRSAVRAANAEADARDQRRREVDSLLAELGGVGEDASRLRTILVDERDLGRPVEALAAEVQRARAAFRARLEATKREADRMHVADALEASLRELGYDVEAGFETALTDEGSALARRGGWSDHAVRVLLDPSTNELKLHVVRDAQLIGSDNVARERELCADRPALEKALAARGVQIDPTELIEPGVVPVALVPLDRARFTRPRSAGHDRAREQAR